METPNPKCKVCCCFWKPEGKDIKPSGLVAKSCPRCRKYQQDKRDYQNGKIYTITSPTSNDVYVGSTITSLETRMTGHIGDWKNGLVLGKHTDIVKDIKDWNIRLYELYPCNNLAELTAKEGQIIMEIGTLNNKISGYLGKEHYIDITTKIKEYRKKQKEDLKIYIKELNDDFKKSRVENANQYTIIQHEIDNIKNKIEEEEQIIEEEERIEDEKYWRERDEETKNRRIEYKIEYKKRLELIKLKDKQDKIDKKEQAFSIYNLKGVIYTRSELKKICSLNGKKYLGDSMKKMVLKLSKIDNIIIPDDLIYNP